MRWCFQVFLMELRKLITYRADFWFNFFGLTIFSLVISYYLWNSIFTYSNSETMNGHNLSSIIFYYLIVPLIFRIQQGEGIGFLSREIYNGTLNKFLLYPIDVFSYKRSTYLAHTCFFFLQLFILLMVYNLFFYSTDIYSFSIVNIFLFIISVFIGTFTYFYLFSIVELMALWFDNTWSLGVILRFATAFFGGALIPLTFFPEWAQLALMKTPFPYLIDVPFKVLTGDFTVSFLFSKLLISVLWLLLFRFLMLYIWNKGKYKYTGVGI